MDRATVIDTVLARRRLEVRGIVQGVGFRPFVHRLAAELALDGWVRNDGQGVTIEAQGCAPTLAELARRVRAEAPRLARVDAVAVTECAPLAQAHGFAILDSGGGRNETAIGPDSAVCDDCLAELFDPRDRRYRYAFINCTNCGPRYTISHELPYDRARTSMDAFTQCQRCLAEYRAPANRRFHAEPNACPACGPQLALVAGDGRRIVANDPIAATLGRLLQGEIVAIKGLGGFHLACDARNAAAVSRLRARKCRDEKPFAVMIPNFASLEPYAHVGRAEQAALASPERPIVLARKRAGTDRAFPGVAPGLAWLGAMLPYTPLQHLIFFEAAGRPIGPAWRTDPQRLVLVMTSANPGGEPLVTDNDEALARLAGIADALLVHDRNIVTRCDDSVVRASRDETSAAAASADAMQFIRRARGYTPRAIRLARAGPSVVAVGGHFKNTVCVTRGDEAFVSQHVGELDNAATCAAHDEAIAHLLSILDVKPAAIGHDLHPDFYATRHAAELARQWRVPLVAVQHHHAHVAAVAAEHRLGGPLLGLALDGVGLGTDGAAWGGELLLVDGARCERLGHLAPLQLPGGDRAAREPWRMAAAALARCARAADIVRRFADEPAAPTVTAMLEQGTRTPATTSLGRWFDAAAGLLGVRRRIAYEGQAAMLLEGLAERHGPVAADSSLFRIGDVNELDFTALLARLADERDAAYGAALFHACVVAGLAEWSARAAHARGLAKVAAGGGCFLNAILAHTLRGELAARGVTLVEARAVPPNDGGIALGQAWVAHAQLAAGN